MDLIRLIVADAGVSNDTLHIHVGLGAFLLVALVFRRSASSPLPWLFAVVVAIAGESVGLTQDLLEYGYWRSDTGLHNIIATSLWPTIFFVTARFTGVFGADERGAP